ncbi:transglutaminase family protein [Polaromonas sp.]|uniref:transglutaminase-like domain-containing protein n=1 Tax=Polaromonas sp. TaxID=1869339 RepID=UPI001DC16E97|nr:transglutaminase family protein [Polaromonas sp.]MBT9477506.1 transglutaminase family protein [Polaromonas sp.]
MHTSLVDCLLEYDVSSPAHFLFNIETAFHEGHRVLEERLTITPSMKVHNFCDERSGNRFIRLDAPRGLLTVNYNARVELMPAPVPLHLDETPVSAVPDDVLRFLMPSRYCESDIMSRAAQHLFGQLPHGIGRVRAIERWIRESIEYLPGFGNSTTSAQEVFVQRAGVCRDFAHLGITLCRALNIPARLVVGYVHFVQPPEDFHAVFEAWLGGQWVVFDPTGMAPIDRMVRIGSGRDAKDVAFATIFGQVQMVRKELTVQEGDTASAPALSLVPPV